MPVRHFVVPHKFTGSLVVPVLVYSIRYIYWYIGILWIVRCTPCNHYDHSKSVAKSVVGSLEAHPSFDSSIPQSWHAHHPQCTRWIDAKRPSSDTANSVVENVSRGGNLAERTWALARFHESR